MAAFTQLRGRIGAAKIVLGETPCGELRQQQSLLQSNAVLALLKQTNGQLTDDEKAKLSTMIADSVFASEHTSAMLAFMCDSSKSTSNRREAQRHESFIYYLSVADWENAKQNLDAALQVMIGVLVHRLGCVNPTEHTLKRLTSVALVCAHGSDPAVIPHDAKVAQLSQVKTW